MFEVSPAAVPAVVTSLLFTSIAFLVVCLRIYVRVFLVKNAGADDYLMAGAMVASIAFCAVVFLQIHNGLGQPFLTLSPEKLTKFLQCLWATIPTYNLSLVLTKLSIVCQYRRIFTTAKVVKLCNIMIGVLVVYGCWAVFASVFMCVPVSNFWNTGMTVHCIDKTAFWFSNASLNIASDLLIFSIPMPLLKQLQLPKKQKIGLMFVFGFGAFVCITSVIRLKSLYEISVSTDTTLDGVNAGIWSGIEINVAIACASLPAIKPLITRILPNLLSNISTRGNRSNSNMNNLSDAHYNDSYVMKAGMGRNKSTVESGVRPADTQNTNGGDRQIKIERTVYQQREVRPSYDGSENSLVVKTDCFAEEQRKKHPLETV